MRAPQKFNIAVVAVAVAMVVILPLLAYLQYTWLGELSKQEYRRMQENVRMAAFHCSMEFSMEMTELMRSLAGPLEGTDEAISTTVLTRIMKWNASASQRALLLHNFTIGALPPAESCVEIKVDGRTSLWIIKNLSAVAIPVQGRPHAAIIVPLNTKYITTTYLPSIIQSYFSPQSTADYEIIVTDNIGSPLWRNPGSMSTEILHHADVVEPLLRFPPVPLSFIPGQESAEGQKMRKRMQQELMNRRLGLPEAASDSSVVQGARSGPAGRRSDRQSAEKQRSLDQEHDNEFNDARWPESPQRMDFIPGRESLLKIHIRHRDGSLEAAVNRNRIHSLAISFSVLLLLGASVIFLLLAARRAQYLAKQQMEFVAGVSHELRTPLAVLKAVGENLADGVIHEAARARQYGELIKKEVTRLSEMVEKALTYASIQSGKKSYELQLLDIAKVVEEAVDKTARLAGSEDVVFNVMIEPDLPQVLGNAAGLKSAVENLLINAVKYSGDTVRVGIEIRRAVRAKMPYLEITVKDDGIGIASKDLPNIFTPFYRADNAVDRQIQGNGLGLSITKHIVDAHRGHIVVVSSLYEGSAFTIQLPIPNHEGERV